ncbi:MAG TPA: carboxypeptidase-like regulatory domain-containing protein [Candidatus Angelobacter sp.]|nr:carboxypeptidase-like regulatory domain-containing protein [Candidatus Angelobacter sp.]
MRRITTLLALLFAVSGSAANASPPPPVYRIAGIVVDSLTGQPLDGAQVTIVPVAALDQEHTFLTSADGRFFFADLPPAKYRLTAGRRGYANQGFHEHEGYSTAIVTGPRQDSEHIRFPLAPNAVLTGVVTDEFGEPVREGKVLLFHQSFSDGAQSLRSSGQTNTDDQGRYRFAHLLPGTYAVAVYAHPWYTQDQGARSFFQVFSVQTVQAEDSPEAVVVNKIEGSLQPATLGQLFDVVYPVTYFPNATRLADAARLSLAPGATETADFQLRAVPSVHLRLSAPVEPPVTITSEEDGQEKSIDVDSSPDVNLSLRIGDDFTDQLQPAFTEIAPGVVELSGIPPGQIQLLATSFINPSKGIYVSRAKTFDISGDTAMDLGTLGSSGPVSGVVQSNLFSAAAAPPSSDQPLPEQPAVELPSNLALSFRSLSSGDSYDTSVSLKGDFSFAPSVLPEGSYEVGLLGQQAIRVSSLEANGARVSGRTVEIAAGQPVNLVVHTVEAKSALSGFALKNGKPIAGAMVLLVPQDSTRGGPLYHRDQSDSDGSFGMAPLFPGRYTLLAIENGWELEWADPAVLFRYLPGGQLIDIPPDASVTHNAKVQ